MRDTKRYWYFITEKDMGETMSLTPRRPINMSDGEPLLKRICVAPTVAHCLSAINIFGPSARVYRTRRRVKGYTTYKVGDSHITKEHWLLGTTRFEHVTTINFKQHAKWKTGSRGGDSEYYHGEQRKDKRSIMSAMRRRDVRLCNIEKANVRWTGTAYTPMPKAEERIPLWPAPTWADYSKPAVSESFTTDSIITINTNTFVITL